MHVGHIILVEAESEQEARSSVEHHLENGYFSWSDWSQLGGRYQDFFGFDGDILNYDDNPTLAEQAIEQAVGYRTERLQHFIKRIEDEGINLKYLEAPKNFEDSYKVYPLLKAAEIASGHSSENSYIWDLEYGSSEETDFRKRVAEKPEHQFLVVVDFHF
jgi:hypothetical protein